jgi:RNase P subunit RPR2
VQPAGSEFILTWPLKSHSRGTLLLTYLHETEEFEVALKERLKNTELRVFGLQIRFKKRYNPDPILLELPADEAQMTLGKKLEKYHGVQCRSCGETILVPARIANKESSSGTGAGGSVGEASFPSLNLRCRICEKENFYKMSDIREIEETAASSGRERPPSGRLRPQAKLSKTAKA